MKVAFLDRDGTLIFEPADGLVRPEDFRILPGVIDGMKALKAAGYQLVMITNQDFSKGAHYPVCFEETQQMLIKELAENGIAFDQIFLCPHPPSDNCNCRKPKSGMIDDFLANNEIDMDTSIIVGDREAADGELAKKVGLRYIKVGPNGTFAAPADLIR